MLKTTGILVLAAAAVVAVTTAADAGPIRDRQARQAGRIHQGVVSGALTPGEAAALRGEQRAINRGRRAALADGFVCPREGRALTRAQNRADRHIRRLKHNRRVAP